MSPDLDALFANGRVVDLVIALTVCEGLFLAWLRRRSGKGLTLSDVVGNLAAGIFLMLALRAALLREPSENIAVWLVAALIAHLADLYRRWRRSG
jgi:hypothetical protein